MTKKQDKNKNKKNLAKANENKSKKTQVRESRMPELPAKLVQSLADEVAKTVVKRLPAMPKRPSRSKKKPKFENAILLDTSAIIDGRVFDVINLGVMTGTVVVPESILLELKHIADSQDVVKRERGQKGLALLDELKKSKKIKVVHLPEKESDNSPKEVDDKLIKIAKTCKGRVITCDYNLEKKASISGLIAININTLANHLKIKAVPGEALHIRVLHVGKDTTQGVGYLDDGTMLVIENASDLVGKDIDVMVSRVIQTSAGKILFSKRI